MYFSNSSPINVPKLYMTQYKIIQYIQHSFTGSSVEEPPIFWAAPEVHSPGAESGQVRSAPAPYVKDGSRRLRL